MTPNTVADNSHNQLLQLSATAGVPAALTFYLILALFFYKGIKYLLLGQEKENHYLVAGFVGGLLAYVIHLFFCVNVIGGGLFIWIFMGAVLALIQSKETVLRINWDLGIRAGLLTIIGLVLLTSWIQLMRYPLADHYYFKFKRLNNMGNFIEAEKNLTKTLEVFPYVWIYPVGGGNFYFQHASIYGDLALFEKAIETFERAQKISPLEFDTYMLKSQTYFGMANQIDKKYFRYAIAELKKGLKLHPKSHMARQLLGICYLNLGEYKLATDSLKQALEIIPNSFLSLYYLGQCYEHFGDIEEAKRLYQETLKANPNYTEAQQALERLGGI